MSIYSGPVFDMARQQFDEIADYMEIENRHRDRLFLPKRSVSVTCPIHRDDGTVAVFQGYRVQHHLSCGPTKGGTRFAPSVDMGEVAALAIWMSWKCALTGLPYGGGKGGITVDTSSLSGRELEALSRRYMQEMIPFVGPDIDVMAPDVGTNEQVMAWFMDTYSVHHGHAVPEIVTGKPIAAGGTAGRREATGRGVVHLIGRAAQEIGLDLRGATAIVQGFGNVGSVAALELVQRGVRVVGISDHSACLYDPAGLPVEALGQYVQMHRSLKGFATQCVIDARDFLLQPCDILVPAALERVIDSDIAAQLKCRILAEGANGPTTPDADRILRERGRDVFVIPDILCNSGGVVVSYFEWIQGIQKIFWEEQEINRRLLVILDRAFDQVLARARRDRVGNRTAALAIGVDRVLQTKVARGLFP